MRQRASLPAREDVARAVEEAIEKASQETGLSRALIGYDIRLYGHVMGDGVERIGVGAEMHRDEMGRRCFDIVRTAEEVSWERALERAVKAIAVDIARLEARRDSFDAGRTGRPVPRRAWDIHPLAASVLTLYPRLPAFDGSHRLDGTVGRTVELGRVPGVERAVIAYGDGVVRLVEARFDGGARLELDADGRMVLHIQGQWPDVFRTGIVRKRASDLAPQLGCDPRCSRVKVTKAVQDTDEMLLTFTDVLVPWDQRARGGESWRRTRMAA